MAGEDIQSKLVLDLSSLGAQIQQVEQRQQQADARTESVVRRVASAEQQVRNVDQLATRLEQKMKSLGRTLFKQGLGAGVVAGLDSLDIGDNPFANFGKNVFVSFAAGTIFSGGNVGIGAISGLTTAVIGLKGLVNDIQQRQQDVEKRIMDEMTKRSEERIRDLREAAAFRDQLRAQNMEIAAQAREDLEELFHQAATLETLADR